MKNSFKKIEQNIENEIDNKSLSFKIFNDPKPKYIARVNFIDKILNKLILWIFPRKITPNQITIFRFITIPFILYFIFTDSYTIGFILFIISALSDLIDGALARTRDQITNWGIVFDPLADKLLIGSVGGILIFKFLNPIIALVIVSIEIILIISAYYRFQGEIVPAKISGKIKMLLQCVGVGLILLFLVIGHPFILILANYVFYLAIIFALLSIFIYRSI